MMYQHNPNNTPFWNQAYQTDTTPWDAGRITTPLKKYIDQLPNKQLKILLPGMGNGHELEYLHQNGFSQCYGLDISAVAVENFKKRVPDFPDGHLITGDFFSLNDSFDLILEQTFFCALSPSLRKKYAEKMHELLRPGGTLTGVLFDFPLTEEGPPFGGNYSEYTTLFSPIFAIHKLEHCYNSIKPRMGREFFFSFQSS